MTLEELKSLAPNVELGRGASEAVISKAEIDCAFRFPAEYREFLRVADGLCGFIGDEYLVLERAAELAEYNDDCGIPEWCPEVFALGGNGGGEVFVCRRDTFRIGLVPLIGMELKAFVDIAGTFDEFLRNPRPPTWS